MLWLGVLLRRIYWIFGVVVDWAVGLFGLRFCHGCSQLLLAYALSALIMRPVHVLIARRRARCHRSKELEAELAQIEQDQSKIAEQRSATEKQLASERGEGATALSPGRD